MSKKEDCTCAC